MNRFRLAPILWATFFLVAFTVVGVSAFNRTVVTGPTAGNGSLGATTVVNTAPTGGAFQAEVAAQANTAITMPFGLLGEYNITSSPAFGTGVLGLSTTGYGIAGESTTSQPSILAFAGSSGPGLQAIGVSGYGVEGMSSTGSGLLAMNLSSGGGASSLGLPTGEGVLASGDSGNSTHPALSVSSLKTGTDLVGTFNSSAQETFVVQASTQNRSGAALSSGSDVQISGDVYVYGRIYTDCAAFPVTSSVSCAAGPEAVQRGSSDDSQNTVEDFGKGQLSNGIGFVRLTSKFSREVAATGSYLVFLTPAGESRGLYVAQRSASGFLIRENSGGRSSISFDYRVIADGSTLQNSQSLFKLAKNTAVLANETVLSQSAEVRRLRRIRVPSILSAPSNH